MADIAYQDTGVNTYRRHTDWSAIWGGAFIFMAIWAVFGTLGMAIFASAANPTATAPVSGMGIGIGIWSIILTIVAMYFAGRETATLAAATDRHNALLHGLIMFGLSVVGLVLLVSIGGSVLSGNTGVNGTAHSSYVLGVFADIGWAGFVALLLGWLAAMFGAQSAVPRRKGSEVREMRPAA